MTENTEQLTEYDQYRVALVLPGSRRVLTRRQGKDLLLPRVSIPKWTRPADELTTRIQEEWNLAAVIIDCLPTLQPSLPCVVAEICEQRWPSDPHGLSAVHPDEISESELSDTEQVVLQEMLAGNTGSRGPFSRIGWLRDAQDWIRRSVTDRAVQFDGDVRQLNADGHFALIRFGTRQAPAYWMKATGAPNSHEYKFTVVLAEHFPRFLPRLITMRNDWNAWVTEEAGFPLCDNLSLSALEQAVLALAVLQKDSTQKINILTAAGFRNLGISALQSAVNSLIDYLAEAMIQQTSAGVPRISSQRLREIGGILHDSCSQMEDIGIPDSLIHNDTNLGNILIKDSRCVFTDWAEGFVGNPFLTFHQLCVTVARAGENGATWVTQLRSRYKNQWLDFVPEAKIDRAFALSPPLAILSHLHGRGDWLQSPIASSAALQSYARSLARHIDRETRSPQLLEALCL
ncbi:MAG: hypothetical protein JWQ42_4294 [Edaphobacter sp.]|nr:hypothetical protein [Edaphobacter sp.]